MHKANSVGIGSVATANQRAISGTAFMSSEKAIEIIDAPVQGMEVCCCALFYSFFFFFSFGLLEKKMRLDLAKTMTR